eukprot:s937_g9.t1
MEIVGTDRFAQYSEVAPALRDYRAAVLNVAKGTQVTVADAFEVDVTGKMKAWSIENDKWTLDIWVEEKRFSYKSTAGKEVALSVSDNFAAWLAGKAAGYPSYSILFQALKAILLSFFEDGYQTPSVCIHLFEF